MNFLQRIGIGKKPGRPPLTPFVSTPDYGLNREQVEERNIKGYKNIPPESKTGKTWVIVLSNILTYFNIIFFCIGGLLVSAGAWNHMTFLFVVVCNTVIGIVQQLNAKRTLDKLKLVSDAKAKVIREGKEWEIPQEEIVADDILCFSAGDYVTVDSLLLSGEAAVNESLITGESEEIHKFPGDKLISGSYLVTGKIFVRAEKVGADSYVNMLSADARKAKKSSSPGMMRSLTWMIRAIGLAIIPIGILLFLNHQSSGSVYSENIVLTTGALVGMIPEGLYLLVSIALSASVIRLAKKKTLVHDMKYIETLARVDMLCVDKTGTITEPELQLSETVLLASSAYPEEKTTALLKDYFSCIGADNDTARAICSVYDPDYSAARPALSLLPFSSVHKFSGVCFATGESYVLGAPERIMQERYSEISGRCNAYLASGKRVLLFAACQSVASPDSLGRITPIALLILSHKIRASAPATFSYFVSSGVGIKVISGDNPLTVSRIALEAGIPNADLYFDASSAKDEKELASKACEYTVFGRVRPEQKKVLISALQKAGHTVAMTGDGVNDVPALKIADCSIAMAGGSDAACRVSDFVLLKNDFSPMPSVVAEGRRVINNIERSASLFLVKNIFSFILAVLAICIGFDYPLTPAQLTLISALTIGIPSFVFALEPNEEKVKGHFLGNVLFRAFPPALTDLFVIGGTLLFGLAFRNDLTDAQISTVTALLIGVVGFMFVFQTARPFNKLKAVMFGTTLALFLLAICTVPWFFRLSPLDLGGYMVLAVFVLMIPSVMMLVGNIFSMAKKQVEKFVKKFRSEEDESDDDVGTDA